MQKKSITFFLNLFIKKDLRKFKERELSVLV